MVLEFLLVPILEESEGCCRPCPLNPLAPPTLIQPMVLKSCFLSKNIATLQRHFLSDELFNVVLCLSPPIVV
jgi:hypothetical protein